MSLIDDVLSKLGAISERAHLFSFTKASAPGAYLRFTRDLRPLPDSGLTGGHLLELYAILDESHPIPDANTKIRFDLLEEDFLLAGGLDDRIVSLLGTGAQPPEAGAPTKQAATQIHELPEGQDVASFVEDYKRTITAYEDTILVITQTPIRWGAARAPSALTCSAGSASSTTTSARTRSCTSCSTSPERCTPPRRCSRSRLHRWE